MGDKLKLIVVLAAVGWCLLILLADRLGGLVKSGGKK